MSNKWTQNQINEMSDQLRYLYEKKEANARWMFVMWQMDYGPETARQMQHKVERTYKARKAAGLYY